MKQILNALGVSAFFTLLLLGCSPGASPVPPMVVSEASINVVKPEKGFYGHTVAIKYATKDAIEVKVNGTTVPLSGTFELENPTANTEVVFTAKNAVGKITTEKVSVLIWNYIETVLLYAAPGKEGVWSHLSSRWRYVDESTWRPGGTLCQYTKFRTDGKTTSFNDRCTPGVPNSHNSPWELTSNGSVIKWFGLNFDLVVADDSTITRRCVNSVNQVWEETFRKR